jgi:peptidoglycan/LPS O-acetylase OafA/YrhL
MTRAATDPYPVGMADSLRFFWKPDAVLGVAWTLRYEAVFYLLMMVYLLPGIRFVGLLLVLLVGAFLEPDRYQFHYGIYFLSGVLITFAKAQWNRSGGPASKIVIGRPRTRWVKGAAVLVLFSLSLYYLSQNHTRNGSLLLIGSYLVADISLKDIFRLRPATKLLQLIHATMLYLGKISYSLYLVHTWIIIFMLKRIPAAKHPFPEMMLMVIPVVLLSAAAFHHIIEAKSVAAGRAVATFMRYVFRPRAQAVVPLEG